MGLLSFIPFGEFIIKEVSKWSERRDAISSAKLEAELAELKAKAEVAAYKVKADIEWDLKWADQAGSSWKDEFMLILWAAPLIGLFIPGIRPFVMEGFDYLKAFNPDVAYWYMAGWAIIFSAVFGFRQAAALMLPGQAGKLAGILANIPDDIPDVVAKKAQDGIDQLLKRGADSLPRG
ncbi:hypothetical protein [Brucella intermedia]|uniref:hypothetical protein n=1 Tax=Brucella intermedia TaxID=94625 RepID=UPI00224A7C58|nr:hypothetical protein [Brucella intermedia]